MWTTDPITNLELANVAHRERIADAERRRTWAAVKRSRRLTRRGRHVAALTAVGLVATACSTANTTTEATTPPDSVASPVATTTPPPPPAAITGPGPRTAPEPAA